MPSALAMPVALRKAAEAATGFLPADEGTKLFGQACVPSHGPALRVGTYCGKSAI